MTQLAFARPNTASINQDPRQKFLALYPNRIQGILRSPGCKTWVTVSKHFPIGDDTICGAISGAESNLWGLRFAEHTRFAVFDIDKDSRYHNVHELQKLIETLAEVGIIATIYQSSDSRGWHVYLFFDNWEDCQEVQNLLKSWLRARNYEIRNGTLEVFPSGMGLRLPLQTGFAWLDPSAAVMRARNELTADEAISHFLTDLSARASTWSTCKMLIQSQLDAVERSAGGGALAHQNSIDTAGFDGLFSYRLIPEKYQDGRSYWQNGLTAMGQRHDAILAVEHYLWHGDSSLGVPALPGAWNDDVRYRLILAWLKEKHNGYCRHINRGNWRKVEAQITRSVKWRRPSNGLRVLKPYPMTERSIERLMALSRATGRTWSPDDLKKGNEGREQKTRAKISAALNTLIHEGGRIGRNELARLSGCSPNSVSKHCDIWLLFASGSGDKNPFLDPVYVQGEAATPERVAPPLSSGSEEEILLPLLGLGDSRHAEVFAQPPGPESCSSEERALAVIRRQYACHFLPTTQLGDVLPTKLNWSGSASQNDTVRQISANSAFTPAVWMDGSASKNQDIRLLRRRQRRLFILPYFVRAARSRIITQKRQRRSRPRAPPAELPFLFHSYLANTSARLLQHEMNVLFG